jgi:peptidoglycan L-alanyl-D-glutamate endopeptidase CwlK
MTFAEINAQRIAQLHPLLQTKAKAFVAAAAQAGIDVLITQALRTIKEQDALYAQGRTVTRDKNGRPLSKVTNAKGGQSMHNYGLAFDFVPLTALGKANWNTADPSWSKLGKIGQSLGLEWGGAWKTFKDLPHFQLVGGLNLKEIQAIYAKSKIAGVWATVSSKYA